MANATRPNVPFHPDPCRGQQIKAPDFHDFAEETWELSRWEREEPRPATIAAKDHKLDCAAGPGHRKAMVRSWALLRHEFLERRRHKLAYRDYLTAITPPGPDVLRAIRECESGGDYSTYTGNGFSGAYQFVQSTWESVGGSGAPHEASPHEQDERAARLYRELGPSPWPVCGV